MCKRATRSICGRIAADEREKMRITIPRLHERCRRTNRRQNQSLRLLSRSNRSSHHRRAVASLKGKEYVEFTTHPHCGMATYLFIEGDDMVPINRYVNVRQIHQQPWKKSTKTQRKETRKKPNSSLLGLLRHIKFGFLRKYLLPIVKSGRYDSLGDLHRKMLLVSSMHFMDPYNFDLERVQRCCIHYAVPDGRIIPFCAMNSIHRAKVEEKMGIPLEEWKKNNKQGNRRGLVTRKGYKGRFFFKTMVKILWAEEKRNNLSSK